MLVLGVVELRINVGEEVGEYVVLFIDGNFGVVVIFVVVLIVGIIFVCLMNDGIVEFNVKDFVLLNVFVVFEMMLLLEGENVLVLFFFVEFVVGVVVVDFLGFVMLLVFGIVVILMILVRLMFCFVLLLLFDVIIMVLFLGVSCV